jgi:hypothetical protein
MKRLTDDVVVAAVLAACVLTLWTGPVVAVALFFLVGPVLMVWALLEHNAREAGTRPNHPGTSAQHPRNRRNEPPHSL